MFTENQSRQFYVVTGTGSDVVAPTQIVPTSSGTFPTDLSAKSDGACQFIIAPDGNEAYFQYKGPGGVVRSDIIKKCNVVDVRCTAAKDLVHKKKQVEVAVASALLSTGNLTVTDDYVLNVTVKNYITGGNNSKLFKYGVAHGASGTSASDLYKKLAISLAKNFARDNAKLITVYVKISSSLVEVKPNYTTSTSAISGTATCVVLEEAEQPWRRGAAPVEYVDFEVNPSTIYNNSEDVIWGTVTDATASNTNVLQNSKKTADFEWFFHKERGDKYGEVGFPYNIDTTYQVNPNATYGYSYVDIHYYDLGNSMNVGKSEKTMTFVIPAKASDPEEYLQKLIGSARVTGGSPADPTGLYAFLEDTDVAIKQSANWDAE